MTRTSTLIAPSSSDVCTPARADCPLASSDLQTSTTTGTTSNTVTPFDLKESSTGISDARTMDEKDDNKDLLLNTKDKNNNASSSSTTSKKDSKRGLVSRRGRGLGNPGQRSSSRNTNSSDNVPFEAPMLHRSSVTFSPSGDQDDAMDFSDDVSNTLAPGMSEDESADE